MFVDYYNDVDIIARQKARTKDAMEGKSPIAYFFLARVKAQKSLLVEIKTSFGIGMVINIQNILHEAIIHLKNQP